MNLLLSVSLLVLFLFIINIDNVQPEQSPQTSTSNRLPPPPRPSRTSQTAGVVGHGHGSVLDGTGPLTNVMQQQCPQLDESTSPCNCNATKKEVFCRGILEADANFGSDLRRSFLVFAQLVPRSLQHFHSVYINMRGLVTLEKSIFAGLQFNTIFLRGVNLTYIDEEAFEGTENFTRSLYIYGTNLTWQAGRNNFFGAIQSLNSMQKLIISQHNLVTIPDG